MRRKALGVLAVVFALGCQTQGGGSATTGPGEGDFQEEPGWAGGLPDRGSMGAVDPGQTGLQPIYFDFDDATLKPGAIATLRRNAEVLSGRSDARIEIQGHCDERGSEEYNLALGQRRAEAARRYLLDMGVNRSRIETKTFGESMPAVRGHDEPAWSKNRRDEFLLLR